MEKKCESCYYYRILLGTEYCLFDVQSKRWEERRKKYEIMCDRFISKNASFDEQMKFLRNHHQKHMKIELWEEKEEQDV